MVIHYYISAYPLLAENMVARVYEAESPLAIVAEELILAPHDNPVAITFNGLDRVVHIVRLFAEESMALLHEYNVQPTADTVKVFDPIRFKIGDGGQYTPPENTNTFTHPMLDGHTAEEVLVFRNGYGVLFPGLHYTLAGDTITLLVSGDVFTGEEEVTVQIKSTLVTTPVNDSVVGKLFAGFVDIQADIDYEPAHLRHLLRFAGNGNDYRFPVGAAIPIGYLFAFQYFAAVTDPVNDRSRILFENAPLLIGNTAVPELQLAPEEAVGVVFDGANWNAVYRTIMQKTDDPKRGDILYLGEYNIGNPVAGPVTFTIAHNQGIVGDYTVMYSFRAATQASLADSATMTTAWAHSPTDKANSFLLTIRETGNATQNVLVQYMLIKL